MPRRPSSSALGARPPASAAELTPIAFARAIAACGPFEPDPAIAVAVSGGPDSLALAVLLRDWAAERGGRLLALHVDHRLRPGSGDEAAALAATLKTLGIENRTLTWDRDAPRDEGQGGTAHGRGVQAAARAARYRLLSAACREAGILHLALAHHRDDQAETLLHRADGGSGPDGLAAMPAVRELPDIRVVRPLLAVPKAALEAVCRARRLTPLRDPSNRDPRFARTDVRARLERLAAGGLDGAALAAMAAAAGVARARRDIAVADRLAAHALLHPAGFARVDPAALVPPDAIALRALARLLACIGGAAWPARGASLQRALRRLRTGEVARLTLGRCLIAREDDGWLVVREPACAGPIRLAPGQTARWDGRFAVGLPATAPGPVTVGALGEAGWQALVAAAPDLEAPDIPHPARVVLPAFRDLEGLWAVPQLGFVSRSARSIPNLGEPDGPVGRFTPVRPLVPEAGFRAFEQADAGP